MLVVEYTKGSEAVDDPCHISIRVKIAHLPIFGCVWHHGEYACKRFPRCHKCWSVSIQRVLRPGMTYAESMGVTIAYGLIGSMLVEGFQGVTSVGQ